MMKLKASIAAALVASTMVGTAVVPVHAATVYIGTPPPAVLVEPVPPPRGGYVWAPGYWRWNGAHHVWVQGHWIVARHGYHYVPDEWVAVNGRWVFRPGHWVR
jgi:hypothetical protein